MMCGALLILFVLSCEIEEVAAPKLEYEPEISVFGLLLFNEYEEFQTTVKIEHTYEISDTLPFFPEQRVVKDAQVFIETDEQRVEFKYYNNDSNYEDRSGRLKMQPGQTYKLDITLADGRHITSQCIMPSKPKIISPRPDSSIEANAPLTVTWQDDGSAYRYQISVKEEMESFYFNEFSATTEEEIFFFVLAPPGKYHLKVASLDQNYYDYLRSANSRQPLSNMNGALGVFGAMAYSKSKFFAVLP
jgi:hypothetical protein